MSTSSNSGSCVAARGVLGDEPVVRELGLRVHVAPPHPRVRRRRVEVPPVLLGVLAVVALRAGQAEDALLQDRVAAVPEREREAERLPVVADAREPVLAPAVGARAGVVVREVAPRVAVGAVVLAHRAPGALAEVRPPVPPRRAARAAPRSAGRARRSQPVGLEQPQPDLAAGRERRDARARAGRSAPRRRPRSSPRGRTPRRRRRRTSRRRATRRLLVDDEPRRARAPCGRRSCRPRCRTSRCRPRARRCPPASAESSVCPTAATCGSVKTTRGESGPPAVLVEPRVAAEDHVGGDAGLVLAHVREQRAAVDVADRVEPVVAGHAQRARRPRSVVPGSRPTVSRPRSRVAARRPTPTSSSSPVSSLARLERDRDARRCRDDLDRRRADANLDAALDQRVVDVASPRTPPRGASSRGAASTIVTCEPSVAPRLRRARRRPRRRRARSAARAPPSDVVASRFVQRAPPRGRGSAGSRPRCRSR